MIYRAYNLEQYQNKSIESIPSYSNNSPIPSNKLPSIPHTDENISVLHAMSSVSNPIPPPSSFSSVSMSTYQNSK